MESAAIGGAERRQSMKAIVIHKYGGPEELKFEEYRDPIPGAGEVLVRVAATSINPFDIKRRSGAAKDAAPINFPGVVGVDVSGTVFKIGVGVSDFSVGDRVFAMSDQTYAELCIVKASSLAKIPAGLDLIEAAALPLVTTTGNELISVGTGIQSGQTVLVTGAVGNLGRSAVFTAKDRGATVIAGVLKRQVQDAASLGADRIVATDDDKAMADLLLLDAVADTVGGTTAEKLMAKVKSGGVFASVLGVPQNAKDFPAVKGVPVYAGPDAKILLHMAEAVKAGNLRIPIGRKLPLQDAAQGHAAVEKGEVGKLLLVVDKA
jgi:NADPH:quinone reductase-like Zn-dependent oxidoreductase